MLIKVEAIIREEQFEDVKQALQEIGVNGMTVSQVMGCGAQWGYTQYVRGMEVDIQMVPKIKFEIVVSSEEWETNHTSHTKSRLHRAGGRWKDFQLRNPHGTENPNQRNRV